MSIFNLFSRTKTIRISHKGLTRKYIYQAPSGKIQKPLVIALHGAYGKGSAFADITGWFAKGKQQGFTVAFPDSYNRLWDATDPSGVDDVGFISTLIDDIARRTPINKSKVFVTGFSNGAMMAHRLGSELSNKIAAIAPHSGVLGDHIYPSQPIPVLHIHGSIDDLVPIDGSGRFMSVAESMDRWHSVNSPAILHIVDGLSHAWAGGSKDVGREFNATDSIWAFFKAI